MKFYGGKIHFWHKVKKAAGTYLAPGIASFQTLCDNECFSSKQVITNVDEIEPRFNLVLDILSFFKLGELLKRYESLIFNRRHDNLRDSQIIILRLDVNKNPILVLGKKTYRFPRYLQGLRSWSHSYQTFFLRKRRFFSVFCY